MKNNNKKIIKKSLLILLLCSFGFNSNAQLLNTFEPKGKDFAFDELNNVSNQDKIDVVFFCQIDNTTIQQYQIAAKKLIADMQAKKTGQSINLCLVFFKTNLKIMSHRSSPAKEIFETECYINNKNKFCEFKRIRNNPNFIDFKVDEYGNGTFEDWHFVSPPSSCPRSQSEYLNFYTDFLGEVYYPAYSVEERLVQLNNRIDSLQNQLEDKIKELKELNEDINKRVVIILKKLEK